MPLDTNERNQSVPLTFFFPHCNGISNRRNLRETSAFTVHRGGEDMAGESRSALGQHGLKAPSHFRKTNRKWQDSLGAEHGGKQRQIPFSSPAPRKILPARAQLWKVQQPPPNSASWWRPSIPTRAFGGHLHTTAYGNRQQGHYPLWPMQAASLRRWFLKWQQTKRVRMQNQGVEILLTDNGDQESLREPIVEPRQIRKSLKEIKVVIITLEHTLEVA